MEAIKENGNENGDNESEQHPSGRSKTLILGSAAEVWALVQLKKRIIHIEIVSAQQCFHFH